MFNGIENDLFTITEDEEEDGSKRVFQTRTNRTTRGEKMRSPLGFWKRSELYIDNSINSVLQRIDEYYS